VSTRLHLLCSADPAAWQDCRGQLSGGDCVLLLDRGVEWLLNTGFLAGFDAASTNTLYALDEDAQARGLAGTAVDRPGLFIDRSGWVRLIETHPHILSWT
jgi:sulfur relay protein TusB/DsrH